VCLRRGEHLEVICTRPCWKHELELPVVVLLVSVAYPARGLDAPGSYGCSGHRRRRRGEASTRSPAISGRLTGGPGSTGWRFGRQLFDPLPEGVDRRRLGLLVLRAQDVSRQLCPRAPRSGQRDVAASFQEAVVDVLSRSRSRQPMKSGSRSLPGGGGANSSLRQRFWRGLRRSRMMSYLRAARCAPTTPQ